MKLGRLRRPDGARYARLVDHLSAPLPAPMRTWDGTTGAVYGMYLNNIYGICVAAGLANLCSTQAAAEGRPGLAFKDEDVKQFYFALTGGGDTGLVMPDTFKAVGASGFLGVRMPHFADVDHTDQRQVQSAACTFSGLAVGVSLPDDFMTGFTDGLWDVSGKPNPDNAHDVTLVGYDAIGPQVVTWGRVLACTWAWWEAYVVEASALFDAARAAVDVLNGASLIDELASLAAQTGQGI